MGVIFDNLAKRNEVSNATPTDKEGMDALTKHYLHENTAGPRVPVIKATAPQGGFGERVAAPTAENPDETELVVDSSIFDRKVRELVQGAGGAYDFKRALQNGTAVKVDPQFAPVVTDPDLSAAMTKLQEHAPLLNAAIAKAQAKRKAGRTMQPQPASESSSGGDSSGEISTCDSTGAISKAFITRVVDAVSNYVGSHLVKADKNPALMDSRQLTKLRDTLRKGTPAYAGVNRLLARALHAEARQ
jgi:hypothetical protein